MLLKHTFLTSLLLVLSISSYANLDVQNEIDSLEHVFENTMGNSSKAMVLSELAFKYGLHDNKKALNTARKALSLAQNGNSDRAIMESKFVLGRLYFEKGDLDSAMILFSNVRPYYENKKDNYRLFDLYRKIAQIHQERSDHDMAKNYYEKSLGIAEILGKHKLLGNAYNDLGSYFILQYRNESSDSVSTKNNLAISKMYLEKAHFHFESIDYKRGLALCLGNLSLISFSQKKYPEALTFALQSKNIFDQLDEDIFVAIALVQICKIYLEMGYLSSAEKTALACLDLSNTLDSRHEKRDAYYLLSKVNEKRGDYKKAYSFAQLYHQTESEVLNQQAQNKIEELEYEYASAQNEKIIAELNLEKILKEEQISKQKQLLIFTSILLVLFVIILILLYRSYRHKKFDNLILTEQKNKIDFQNKELQLLNNKISEQNAEIKGQKNQLNKLFDEHKNLMMMVVHDLQSPFNKIKGLSNILNLSVGLTPEQKEINDKIENVAESGRALINELTNIAYLEDVDTKLNKSLIPFNEFIIHIHREHEAIAWRKNIALNLKTLKNDIQIKSDKDFLKRVLENLISNAIKFSQKGKKVLIDCHVDDQQLKIEIQDQGPGISKKDQNKLFGKFQRLSARPTAGENSTGLGLSIVKTIMAKLDGEIIVESKLGEGSTFIICLPLELNYAK